MDTKNPESMGFNELLEYLEPYYKDLQEFESIIGRYHDRIKEWKDQMAPYLDRLKYHMDVKNIQGKRYEKGFTLERKLGPRRFTVELHQLPESWKPILTRIVPAQVKLITVKELDDLLKSREDLNPDEVKGILGLTQDWQYKIALAEPNKGAANE